MNKPPIYRITAAPKYPIPGDLGLTFAVEIPAWQQREAIKRFRRYCKDFFITGSPVLVKAKRRTKRSKRVLQTPAHQRRIMASLKARAAAKALMIFSAHTMQP